jgi:hypothetical protein
MLRQKYPSIKFLFSGNAFSSANDAAFFAGANPYAGWTKTEMVLKIEFAGETAQWG